jgi:hypothetical protein
MMDPHFRNRMGGLNDAGRARNPHDRGLTELLRLRGPEGLQSSVGRRILTTVQKKLLMTDLDRASNVLTTSIPELLELPESLRTSQFTISLFTLITQTSHLCHTIMSQLGKPPEERDIDQLGAACQRVGGLLFEMGVWAKSVEDYWGYSTLPGASSRAPFGGSPLYPKTILYFPEIRHAFSWSGYWCSQVRLLEAMLSALPVVSEEMRSKLPSQQTLEVALQGVIDDICGAVPYMLGDVDARGQIKIKGSSNAVGAFVFARVLWVATSVDIMPITQREWIYDQFLRIGHVFGLRHALNLRDYRMTEDRLRHARLSTDRHSESNASQDDYLTRILSISVSTSPTSRDYSP